MKSDLHKIQCIIEDLQYYVHCFGFVICVKGKGCISGVLKGHLIIVTKFGTW